MITWLEFCERAGISLDSGRPADELAARYEQFTGEIITPREVGRTRAAFRRAMTDVSSITFHPIEGG